MSRLEGSITDDYSAACAQAGSPDALRRGALVHAARAVRADGALWLRVALVAGDPRVFGVLATEPDVERALCTRMEGRRVAELDLPDPRAPRAASVQRFVSVGSEPLVPGAVQAHLLAYDGRRFVGMLAVYRRTARGFGRGDRALLERLAPEVVASVVGIDRAERARHARPAQLVVEAGGAIRFATDGSDDWELAALGPAIGKAVSELAASGAGEAERLVRGAQANLTRLVGEPPSYLVTLTAPSAPEVQPASLLTSRQREIADLAIGGGTCAQIASELAISEETIRHHIKEVYARLGIASRVELANLLRPAGPV